MKMHSRLKTLLAAMLAVMMLASCNTTGSGGGTSATPAPSAAESTGDAQSESGAPTAEATSTGGKILKVNNQSEPGYLHPGMATGTHDSWAIDHMFEGLWRKDPEGGAPILGMAIDVQTSEDGLVWTWKINPDAKWSNGDPVTAHDFVAAWQYAVNPDNAARYGTQMYIFENGKEVHNGEKEVSELGVRAIDDTTLEATLVNPMGYLSDYMTHYTFYPINAANAEAHPDWSLSGDNYVSNGAFTLTEWRNKESLTLTKNQNYLRANEVKLDGIYFTIIEDITTTWQKFQQGELDVLYPLPPAVIEQLRNENSPLLYQFPDLSTYYYYLNTEVVPLNNVKVRKALAMSIDRTAIADNVMKGGEVPAFGLTPPGISDGNGDYQANLGDLFHEDIEEAKALLAEGLAEEGMTLEDFSFTILYNTHDTHKKVAEAIQAMWKQNLSVNVEMTNAEFQVVLDRRKAGDFDVCRAGWIGDYSDPMTFLELFTSWSDYNDGRWYNDRYDELILSATKTTDNDVRMKAFKEAETILMEEIGVMPIYFYTKNWAIQEKVTGYYTPVNRFVQLQFADIAE